MKAVVSLVAVVALVGCADVSVDPEQANENSEMASVPDRPNRWQDANRLSDVIDPDYFYTNDISPATDVDVFAMPVVAGHTYSVLTFVEPEENLKTVLYVMDAANARIVGKDLGHGPTPGGALTTFTSTTTGTVYPMVGSHLQQTQGRFSLRGFEQLVFNPLFESGSANWTGPFGTRAFIVDDGTGLQGEWLRMDRPLAGVTRVEQSIPSAGAVNRVGLGLIAYIEPSLKLTNTTAKLQWRNGAGVLIRQNAFSISACDLIEGWESEYRYCDVAFNRPSEATQAKLVFEVTSGTGSVYIDDVVLQAL